VGCSRSILECYPEDQKRPVLLYLDESRQVADEFVQLLAEHKSKEISTLHKPLSVWIQGKPNREVDLATLERELGEITHYEYRGQEVYYLCYREIDLVRGEAATWYVVRTANSKASFATLQIATRRARDTAKPVVESVFFNEWADRPIPTWLRDENAPAKPCGCEGMMDGLRVKAS